MKRIVKVLLSIIMVFVCFCTNVNASENESALSVNDSLIQYQEIIDYIFLEGAQVYLEKDGEVAELTNYILTNFEDDYTSGDYFTIINYLSTENFMYIINRNDENQYIQTRGTLKAYSNTQTIIYTKVPIPGYDFGWIYAVDVVVTLYRDKNSVGAEVTVRGPTLRAYDNVSESVCDLENTHYTVSNRQDTLSADGKTGSVRYRPYIKWQNNDEGYGAYIKVTVIVGASTQPRYEVG